MKTDAITISPNKTVSDAKWLFHVHRIGGLPVVEDGKLIGIFTLADLKKGRAGTTKIRAVMTPNPVVVHADEKLGEVFDKMADNRIGRIPVVSSDGKTLVGLVSLSDIQNLSRMHALRDYFG